MALRVLIVLLATPVPLILGYTLFGRHLTEPEAQITAAVVLSVMVIVLTTLPHLKTILPKLALAQIINQQLKCKMNSV